MCLQKLTVALKMKKLNIRQIQNGLDEYAKNFCARVFLRRKGKDVDAPAVRALLEYDVTRRGGGGRIAKYGEHGYSRQGDIRAALNDGTEVSRLGSPSMGSRS